MKLVPRKSKDLPFNHHVQQDVVEFIVIFFEYSENEIKSLNIEFPTPDHCYSVLNTILKKIFGSYHCVIYECQEKECKMIKKDEIETSILKCFLSDSKINNDELKDLLRRTYTIAEKGQILNCSNTCQL